MKDKLILKNETEIEIESGASLSDIRVLFDTKKEMISTWDMLTPENISFVRIVNGDGVTVGNYSDLVLVSETSSEKDGKIDTSFNMREKTDMEKRLDALENGQEVQDGAIADLGAAFSDLAEGELNGEILWN